MAKRFNFSANAVDFGTYEGCTLRDAMETFASDGGYRSWDAMVEQANDNGGNSVEIREVLDNAQLSAPL